MKDRNDRPWQTECDGIGGIVKRLGMRVLAGVAAVAMLGISAAAPAAAVSYNHYANTWCGAGNWAAIEYAWNDTTPYGYEVLTAVWAGGTGFYTATWYSKQYHGDPTWDYEGSVTTGHHAVAQTGETIARPQWLAHFESWDGQTANCYSPY